MTIIGYAVLKTNFKIKRFIPTKNTKAGVH